MAMNKAACKSAMDRMQSLISGVMDVNKDPAVKSAIAGGFISQTNVNSAVTLLTAEYAGIHNAYLSATQ